MSGIFQIGTSALNAAQAGVATAGQNIANVNTEGYSRQQVVTVATKPQAIGFGYLGNGVEISDVRRVVNQFLQQQTLSAESSAAESARMARHVTQIDNLLADPDAGLSPAMQDFFGSLQTLSSAPADAAPRQAFLSSAAILAGRFRETAGRLEQINQGINLDIQDGVGAVNQASRDIAALNEAIARSAATSSGMAANDLLDLRDQALTRLSREVRISVTEQAGSLNVYAGNGQPLVIGSTVHAWSAEPSALDPTQWVVHSSAAPGASQGAGIELTSTALQGGRLGGLVLLREQVMRPAENALDRLAAAFAGMVNAEHVQGMTPSGVSGADIFRTSSPWVSAHPDNAGDLSLSASITAPQRLLGADYRLSRVGDEIQLRRLSDGKVIARGAELSDVLPATAEEGFSVQIQSGSLIADGDVYLIRPTAQAASQMALHLGSPSEVATALQAGLAGDNRTALNILALQTQRSLDGGSASFQEAYRRIVSDVGSRSQEIQRSEASNAAVLTQAQNAVQEASGVNLDEEAADLIRYQQAYQAAGKVLQTAQQMFETLLGLSRT